MRIRIFARYPAHVSLTFLHSVPYILAELPPWTFRLPSLRQLSATAYGLLFIHSYLSCIPLSDNFNFL